MTKTRIVDQVGDKIVVTDIVQRILPANVLFDDLVAAVVSNYGDRQVHLEFEGFTGWAFVPKEAIWRDARIALAHEIARKLEGDGVIVSE
jgi:hypothetical protein